MNLQERGELIGFLRKHGVDPDKGLGQHFLCSQPIVSQILTACSGFSSVLEIGPGPGILTEGLSKTATDLVAVELDPRMLPMLKVTAPNCRVIQGDALRVNLPEILDGLPEPRLVVSNMPYYITGPLLEVFARARGHFSKAVLMMQLEVGNKIIARPGKRERGALSINLQTQFTIKRLMDVPAKHFLPPPKVDSVVLEFTPRFDEFSDQFFKIVKAGCSQPRKTLANNLTNTLRLDRVEVTAQIESIGLIPTIRGNELTEADWLALEKAMAPKTEPKMSPPSGGGFK